MSACVNSINEKCRHDSSVHSIHWLYKSRFSHVCWWAGSISFSQWRSCIKRNEQPSQTPSQLSKMFC